jgi:hypothetical protein
VGEIGLGLRRRGKKGVKVKRESGTEESFSIFRAE